MSVTEMYRASPVMMYVKDDDVLVCSGPLAAKPTNQTNCDLFVRVIPTTPLEEWAFSMMRESINATLDAASREIEK